MPTKRLAMTVDGKLTYCTADDEHVGKGRCNHVAHQGSNEKQEEFLARANNILREKNKKDDLDLEGIEETKYLDEFLPYEFERNNGGLEGIRCVDGSLRFVRMFNISDFKDFQDGALEKILFHDEEEEPKIERLFAELDLPYTGNCDCDGSTFAAHILKQNMSKFNPYPEWGEPQIEDHGYIDPEAAFGYSWPLDSVLDKLSDKQIVFAHCSTEPDNQDDSHNEINRDDPTLQRLYSRAMKIEKARIAVEEEQAASLERQIKNSKVEKLITNPDPEVRIKVAKQGIGLDKLVDDSDWEVRRAVAEQGYGLDKLVKDQNYGVRRAVAEQGYGLDQLVDDPEEYVRRTVAKQGYGLDKLVKDPNYEVRCVVAQQGYGLDELANDKSPWVRAEVANQGHHLDKLINDENYNVRCKVADQGYGLDKLIKDPVYTVRCAVVKQGYGLDKLVNDPDWVVREEVARQGYGLNQLIYDREPNVRAAAERMLKNQNKE